MRRGDAFRKRTKRKKKEEERKKKEGKFSDDQGRSSRAIRYWKLFRIRLDQEGCYQVVGVT